MVTSSVSVKLRADSAGRTISVLAGVTRSRTCTSRCADEGRGAFARALLVAVDRTCLDVVAICSLA
jgi:hypothetical protein